MAASPYTKPNTDKVRKRSFSGGLPALNRSGSMADKTLLGVLNILRMDDEPTNTFIVRTILPDGDLRLVSEVSILVTYLGCPVHTRYMSPCLEIPRAFVLCSEHFCIIVRLSLALVYKL